MCFISGNVLIPSEINDKVHSLLLYDSDHDLHYCNSFKQILANSDYDIK